MANEKVVLESPKQPSMWAKVSAMNQTKELSKIHSRVHEALIKADEVFVDGELCNGDAYTMSEVEKLKDLVESIVDRQQSRGLKSRSLLEHMGHATATLEEEEHADREEPTEEEIVAIVTALVKTEGAAVRLSELSVEQRVMVSALRRQLSQLIASSKKLQVEAEVVSMGEAKAYEMIEDQKKQIAELEGELAHEKQLREASSASRIKLLVLERDNHSLQERLNSANMRNSSEMAHLTDEIHHVRDKLGTTTLELHETQEGLAAANAEVERLREENGALCGATKDTFSAVDELKRMHDQELLSLQEKLMAEAVEEVGEVARQLDNSERAHALLDVQLHTAEREVEKLQQEKLEAELQIEQLQQERLDEAEQRSSTAVESTEKAGCESETAEKLSRAASEATAMLAALASEVVNMEAAERMLQRKAELAKEATPSTAAVVAEAQEELQTQLAEERQLGIKLAQERDALNNTLSDIQEQRVIALAEESDRAAELRDMHAAQLAHARAAEVCLLAELQASDANLSRLGDRAQVKHTGHMYHHRSVANHYWRHCAVAPWLCCTHH